MANLTKTGYSWSIQTRCKKKTQKNNKKITTYSNTLRHEDLFQIKALNRGLFNLGICYYLKRKLWNTFSSISYFRFSLVAIFKTQLPIRLHY